MIENGVVYEICGFGLIVKAVYKVHEKIRGVRRVSGELHIIYILENTIDKSL